MTSNKIESIEKIVGLKSIQGASYKILNNGDEIFPAMLKEIKNAKQTIEFQTYVFWQGKVARTFTDALCNAAKRGVEVRVLIDDIGKKTKNKANIKKLHKSKVKVVIYRKIGWKFWEWLNRNHKKILVCDNKIAFTGGVGIADEWMGNANNSKEWRDIHFKIKGPAVDFLRAAFISDWKKAKRNIEFAFKSSSTNKPQNTSKTIVIKTESTVNKSTTAIAFETMIYTAQKELIIVTPYFNPDSSIIKAIHKANRKDVQISIVTSGKYNDSILSRLRARYLLKHLIEKGITVYEYQKSMLHSKLILVDDDISCIGSMNFNYRSMVKDQESMLICSDKTFAKKLKHIVAIDIKQCKKIKATDINTTFPLNLIGGFFLKMIKKEL